MSRVDDPEDDAGHGATPRMMLAIAAVAQAIFAKSNGPPPQERVDWLVSELDDFLARSGAKARWLFRLSLLAVSVLAPLFLFRFVPLRALPLEERSHALDKMESSRFALPLLAVKAMLCIIYYEHPDAAREIGFDGICLSGEKT